MQRLGWTAGALGAYVVVSVVARQMPGFPGPNQPLAWIYVLGYGLFGALLLGAVARWWHDGSRVLWRPMMLCLGGIAAALEIWMNPHPLLASFWNRWMLALFGLLMAALAVRFFPRRLIALWLGVDRRLPHA